MRVAHDGEYARRGGTTAGVGSVQLLDLKTGIDFGASGNLKEFSPTGFSPVSDAISTWSEAAVAELAFRLPPLRHDLQFAVEVFPFLANGLIPRQDCWVFLNGLFVYYHMVKASVEMVFTVPREVFSPRANRLSFALPNATAPKDLAVGDDLRLLGLSFVRLSANDPAVAPAARAEPATTAPAAAPEAAARTTATPRVPATPAAAAGGRAEPARPPLARGRRTSP